MASAAPDRQILGLDLIRFAAASLVMLFHLAFASWAGMRSQVRDIVDGAAAFPALVPFSWFGWVGVEIFFVLSGIVICRSAEGATAFGFARNRLVRLYPAAWVCATLALGVLLLVGQNDLVNRYARSLLLFPAGPWVAAVYWTLAYEIAFYALIFLLLLAGKFRHLGWLLAILGLASTAYWVLFMVDRSGSLGPTAHALLMLGLRTPAKFVLGFGCFFALGGFLYLCLWKQFTVGRLALILACGVGSVLRIVWRAGGVGQAVDMPLDPLVPVAVWGVAIALMAASLICHDAVNRRLRRHVFAIREAGLATYPLYLLHAPIGAAVLMGLCRIGVDAGLALAAAILVAVALAFGVSLSVERYLQKKLRHAFDRGAFAARAASLRNRRV